MKSLIFMYSWRYAEVLVYMLQSTEYKVPDYVKWLHRTKNFSKVMYRRQLDKTKAARMLVAAMRFGMILQVLIGLLILVFGYRSDNFLVFGLGVFLVFSYPTIWAYLVTLPLQFGRWFIMNPKYRREVKASESVFVNHPGVKIAVAGSYGKTSMKELLKTVLSEGKNVAATPANKNVAISHARFAGELKGDEDILVIEYGEGAPGDVVRFSNVTHPDIGIITGLAPAHLDQYPSLVSAGKDIFALSKYVGADNTYVNNESEAVKDFLKPDMHTYDHSSVLGWKISNIKLDFTGIKFEMKKGSQTLHLRSGLLGRHQVGPLAVVAALAHKLGLTKSQIEKGISKTKAFEHRMQPRNLRGAWILDDTYNGNIDGMKAGLKLLQELPAKRKIYVTPGLVDQGEETKHVHVELGLAIAKADPDKVVLMFNSATRNIEKGLEKGGYKGQIQVEHYPLDYYVNLEHFVAAGDVFMLQNDWTDNYS